MSEKKIEATDKGEIRRKGNDFSEQEKTGNEGINDDSSEHRLFFKGREK